MVVVSVSPAIIISEAGFVDGAILSIYNSLNQHYMCASYELLWQETKFLFEFVKIPRGNL